MRARAQKCPHLNSLFELYSMNSLLQKFEMMDDAMADILRQKTETQRLHMAGRMWKSARVLLRGSIRTFHPDWTEEQVNRELVRRISHGVIDHDFI